MPLAAPHTKTCRKTILTSGLLSAVMWKAIWKHRQTPSHPGLPARCDALTEKRIPLSQSKRVEWCISGRKLTS